MSALTASIGRYIPDHDEGGARDDALVGGALQQGGDLLQLLAAHVDRLGRVRREGHVTVTRITSHKSEPVLGRMSGHVYVARHSNTCHSEPLAAHVIPTPACTSGKATPPKERLVIGTMERPMRHAAHSHTCDGAPSLPVPCTHLVDASGRNPKFRPAASSVANRSIVSSRSIAMARRPLGARIFRAVRRMRVPRRNKAFSGQPRGAWHQVKQRIDEGKALDTRSPIVRIRIRRNKAGLRPGFPVCDGRSELCLLPGVLITLQRARCLLFVLRAMPTDAQKTGSCPVRPRMNAGFEIFSYLVG